MVLHSSEENRLVRLIGQKLISLSLWAQRILLFIRDNKVDLLPRIQRFKYGNLGARGGVVRKRILHVYAERLQILDFSFIAMLLIDRNSLLWDSWTFKRFHRLAWLSNMLTILAEHVQFIGLSYISHHFYYWTKLNWPGTKNMF